MAKRVKEKPHDRPTWNGIRYVADAREKQEMDLVSREFSLMTFVGRIVANWCQICGKWRMHYVPKSQEQVVTDGFAEERKFSCTKCKAPILLIVDAEHTILRNA